MKVVVRLEITGLEHWGLTREEMNGTDKEYWKQVSCDIVDTLEEQFGRQHLKVIGLDHEN